MATRVKAQFPRVSAPGQVKRLQYLIESFSALSAPSLCRFFRQIAVNSRQIRDFPGGCDLLGEPVF
jgi:hypothetical protein